VVALLPCDYTTVGRGLIKESYSPIDISVSSSEETPTELHIDVPISDGALIMPHTEPKLPSPAGGSNQLPSVGVGDWQEKRRLMFANSKRS